MNNEIKAQWVEALRSGEYQQGKAVLNRDNESYCCLGVLCELAHAAGVVVRRRDWHFRPGGRGNLMVYGEEGSDNVPPDEVVEWSGLSSPGGTLSSRIRGAASLWELNDVVGMSFDEIADVIEEQF